MFAQTKHLRKVDWQGALLLVVMCLLVLIALLRPTVVAAQPTGYQEYYVLGFEEHMWRSFLSIFDGPPARIPGKICSTVSLVATAHYQVIYYDHWEDGYEADLLNPVQPTTEIYGDGDLSNGGWGSDILLAGDDLSLTSDRDETGPDAILGYVPVDPRRDPVDIRYDGGDHIISSGGPVDLTHAMWPLDNSWVGGAWEIFSRQAYVDSFSYRLPIGEDLYEFGGGDAGTYGDFRNVHLQLGAFEDNTTVTINNGSDVVNVRLDRGRTYSSLGYINSITAPSITIKSGTTIRSNKPTQVGLVTGADSQGGDGFQGRFFIVQSDQLWGADYVIPIPSGEPGDEAEVYLANPNDFPITINAYDAITQTTFVISSSNYISATVPYSTKRGNDGYVPQDSAARFTSSDGVFGVVVAANTSDITYDWGFAGIPAKFLTRDYYVSWAPGTTDLSANGSPVWVTPLTDGTTFFVDYSPLDGVRDETFTLDVLQQRLIFDPDKDNTGTHIWATGEFAIAWGEDPRTAGVSTPYLDLGVAVLPLLQRWLDPVLTFDKTVNPAVLPPQGGTVTYTLVAESHGSTLVNVDLTDTLPINWAYVPGSAVVTYPDGHSEGVEPVRQGQDLGWDLSLNLDIHQGVTVTFQASISQTGGVEVTAFDGFESNTYDGGVNWAGDWQEQGDDGDPNGGAVRIVTENAPFAGSHHLEIRSADNSLSRAIDLDRFVVPLLNFRRRVEDLEGNEEFYLDVFNGLDWETVYTLTDGNLEGIYEHEIVDLSPYADSAAQIRFRSGASVGSGDYLYIDNVEVCEGLGTSVNVGNAVGQDPYSQTFFRPSDEATVYISPLSLVKSVDRTQAAIGDRLVYTLSYANLSDSLTATNVTLRDAAPVQSVRFLEASDGGTYSAPSGSVIWDLGSLPPRASGVVTFSVQVNNFVKDGTVLKNAAYLRGDRTRAGSNKVHTTIAAPSVVLSKSGPAVGAREQVVTYTLSYENVGGSNATGVVIVDDVPPETDYVAGSLAINTGAGWVPLSDAPDDDQGAYISPTLVITPGASAGTLFPGESGQIRFSTQIRTDLPSASLVLNSAILSRDLDIPRESNMVATAITDLQLEKQATQKAAAPSGVISYTLTGTNLSPDAIHTNVFVEEPVPAYTSFVPGTAYGGDALEYSWDNGATWSSSLPITPVTHLRWYQSELPPKSQRTVGFAVRVNPVLPPGSQIRNTARITSTQTAVYFSQWIPSNEVEVETVDLWLEKHVNQPLVIPGEAVAFSIRYGNRGSTDAEDVRVEDTLPDGMTYVPTSIWGSGADDTGAPELVWNVGTVNAGASYQTVGYATTVDPASPIGTVITNSATLSSIYGLIESDPVTVTITESTTPEFSLFKWTARNEVFAGSALDYSILVGNSGVRAQHLVVSDTLPANTAFVDCDCTVVGMTNEWEQTPQSQGNCGAPFTCGLEGDIVVWRVDEMAAGRFLLMTFCVAVDDSLDDGTLIVNKDYAVVADQMPQLNGSEAVTTTVRQLSLTISKTAWPDPVMLGGELHYTITVHNDGRLLQALAVTDLLPLDVSYVPDSCGGAALCEVAEDGRPEVRWWLPSLPTGAEQNLTMRVVPGNQVGDYVVNEYYSIKISEADSRIWGEPVAVTVKRPLIHDYYFPIFLVNGFP